MSADDDDLPEREEVWPLGLSLIDNYNLSFPSLYDGEIITPTADPFEDQVSQCSTCITARDHSIVLCFVAQVKQSC